MPVRSDPVPMRAGLKADGRTSNSIAIAVWALVVVQLITVADSAAGADSSLSSRGLLDAAGAGINGFDGCVLRRDTENTA